MVRNCSCAILLMSVDVDCVLCTWGYGSLFCRNMPIDAAGFLCLFNSSHFLPSGWAGIAPCCMNIFAHCASRGEPFYPPLLAVPCLVLFCTIATDLGSIALSADVAII